MQDIIDKIKAAEKEAENAKSRAQKEADEILAEAKTAGKKFIDDKILCAGAEAKNMAEKAQKEAADMSAKKVASAEKEADEILKTAYGRMDAAVDKIVERVVTAI